MNRFCLVIIVLLIAGIAGCGGVSGDEYNANQVAHCRQFGGTGNWRHQDGGLGRSRFICEMPDGTVKETIGPVGPKANRGCTRRGGPR